MQVVSEYLLKTCSKYLYDHITKSKLEGKTFKVFAEQLLATHCFRWHQINNNVCIFVLPLDIELNIKTFIQLSIYKCFSEFNDNQRFHFVTLPCVIEKKRGGRKRPIRTECCHSPHVSGSYLTDVTVKYPELFSPNARLEPQLSNPPSYCHELYGISGLNCRWISQI